MSRHQDTDKKKEVILPNTPQDGWTKKFNFEWLRLRGLETDGSAKELSKRVSELIDKPNCPPKLNDKISSDYIIRMLASGHNALAYMMSKYSDDAHNKRMHLSILRMLNDVEFLDKLMRGKSDAPIWTKHYNLLCLLNVAENNELLGPARCRWEGGKFGEKVIRTLKNNFTSFQDDWQGNLHKDYFDDRAVEFVKEEEDGKAKSASRSPKDEVRNLHIYRCGAEVFSNYLLKKPLVLAQRYHDGAFGIIHSTDVFWKLSTLAFIGEDCHAFYFNLELEQGDMDKSTIKSAHDVSHVAIAIPSKFKIICSNEEDGANYKICDDGKVGDDIENKYLYCIENSERMELDDKLRFVFPYK